MEKLWVNQTRVRSSKCDPNRFWHISEILLIHLIDEFFDVSKSLVNSKIRQVFGILVSESLYETLFVKIEYEVVPKKLTFPSQGFSTTLITNMTVKTRSDHLFRMFRKIHIR